MRAFFIALFTPLARRMRGISPNTLTLVSVLSGIAAGGAFVLAGSASWWYGVAAALLAVSGAADSLDGIVARMSARTSRWGDFLDHFGDRLVEATVLVGIAFSPHAHRGLGLLVVIVTLLHSDLGTQIEASFGERRREGPGKEELFVALIAFALALLLAPRLTLSFAGLSASLPDAFLAGLGVVTAAGILHRLVIARRLSVASRTPE